MPRRIALPWGDKRSVFYLGFCVKNAQPLMGLLLFRASRGIGWVPCGDSPHPPSLPCRGVHGGLGSWVKFHPSGSSTLYKAILEHLEHSLRLGAVWPSFRVSPGFGRVSGGSKPSHTRAVVRRRLCWARILGQGKPPGVRHG